MSESANIQQNLQNVPSIFEITAAETLDNLISPALSKIFDWIGLHIDFKLWNGLRIREEFSPFITWAMQYFYLRSRSASFGENFYNLQRTKSATSDPLTSRQKLISATLLTFLPHIEYKLKARSAQHENDCVWEQVVLKLFHAYNVAKSVHTFLYLIKYSGSHSPIFRALGLNLQYPAVPPQENRITFIFLKMLELMAFFLQFIQWWYTKGKRRKMGGSLRNPPAMKESLEQKRQWGDLPPKGFCPICLMEIITPTACSVSGFVYCWKCIALYLKNHSKCPVTGYPITIDDLVRVYEM